jgi:hypothetical protein
MESTTLDPADKPTPSFGFGAFLAWDGVLPLVIALLPPAVDWLFPKDTIAQIGVSVFVPIIAALVRSVIGARQIRSRCQGELPVLRQIAMAGAILLLLFFEASVAALTFAEPPLALWLLPAGFYLAYLAALALALLPRSA